MAIKLALAADFEELGIPFCYTCGDTLMEEYTADHKRNIFDVYQLSRVLAWHELTCPGPRP